LDIARKFRPDTILLWEKVADDPEARRIVKLFPSAQIKIINHQRYFSHTATPGRAIVEGKQTLMIGQTSSFVGDFTGQLGDNVRCCPYYKLVPVSNGCPYYCSYCYLAYVYRKHHPFIKININYDTMLRQIAKLADGQMHKISFNMGEMLDSIALDHVTNLTSILVPFFSRFRNAFLMLLTKSSSIDNLLSLKPNSQTVVSWSLNSDTAIKTFEPGTASLDERLDAAKRCQKHGYRIRFRIDPGILHLNWRNAYAEMIQKMFASTEPENITLGMLRLVPGHLRLAQQAYQKRAENLCNQTLTSLASDGKLRYPEDKRIEFYSHIIDAIHSFNKTVSISLCRETPRVWIALKNHRLSQTCNCLG